MIGNNKLKILDYYFFCVGVASLVIGFFVLFSLIEFYYILIFFYALNFCISFLLNLAITKRIKELYIFDTQSYIINHLIAAVISSIITMIFLIFVENILDIISIFLGMNSIMMFVALVVVFMRAREGGLF